MAEKKNEENSCLIKEGDRVLIRKEKNIQCFEVTKGIECTFDRMHFKLDGVLGHPYGSVFEVHGRNVTKVDREKDEDGGVLDQNRDNRDLQDTSDNQKLTHDDVVSLRQQGVSGQDIIEKLVENSATFSSKTEFAQKKYLNRKKKKHLARFIVFRPTTRMLAEMYFNKSPHKICYMRVDSLSQMLTISNVRAHSRVLVMESCVGMLVGACLERMGGLGQLVQIHTGLDPVRTAVHNYGFPEKFYESLYQFPLHLVSTLRGKGSGNIEVTGNNGSVVEEAADTEMQDDQDENGDSDEPPNKKIKTSANRAENKDSNKQKQQESWEKNKQQREQRKHDREEKTSSAREVLSQGAFDGLLVATRLHPSPVVMSLIDLVAPDRTIAVFCVSREPLVDLYQRLRDRGVINLRLTETWWRHYQVLPNRTRPSINMSSESGYILSGIMVGKSDSTSKTNAKLTAACKTDAKMMAPSNTDAKTDAMSPAASKTDAKSIAPCKTDPKTPAVSKTDDQDCATSASSKNKADELEPSDVMVKEENISDSVTMETDSANTQECQDIKV